VVLPEQGDALLSEIGAIVENATEREDGTLAVMRRISERLPHYHWVGVYALQGDDLVLGPYVGAPTEHTRIPVGRGVCGTAIVEGKNQIIEDVRNLDNYLACSLETRSEIVVLMRDGRTGRLLGQIDADSHAVGAFDRSDEAFLERVAARIAPLWEDITQYVP
jgi:GAF domain-containing protein